MASKPRTAVGPVRTPEGRLSWMHLAAPNTGGNYPSGKYETTLLIPKEADLSALKAAIVQAAKNEFPDMAARIRSIEDLVHPLRDGDDKEGMDGYPGHVFIKPKSNNKPPLVGPDKREYTGPIKAGDFAVLAVTAGGYRNNVTKEIADALKAAGKLVTTARDERGTTMYYRPAVTFYLDAVQFRREGNAFNGGSAKGVNAFEECDNSNAAGNVFE